MVHAPLTTRNIRRAKGTDEVQSLKRRLAGAARLDLDVVHLRGVGPTLLRARRVKGPASVRDLVTSLRRDGGLDRAVLERNVELVAPPLPLDALFLASAHRDLRVLAEPPMLALAREHRRTLARFGAVDAEWVAERRSRLSALMATSAPGSFTDTIVELVRAMRGDDEAALIARAFAALDARPAERRADAERRVLAIASGDTGDDAELARLAERLDAARDFPGRARKRRMHDVMRQAVGWPLLPASLMEDDFLASADAAIGRMPLERDETLAEVLAQLALVFRVGDHGVPALESIALDRVVPFIGVDLTLAQACALSKLDLAGATRTAIAKLVAEGLDVDLVATMVEKKLQGELADLEDVRAARAYATWSLRLAEHEQAHGVSFKLKPALFESLPKNEDLAVLTLCLLDHTAKPGTDPIAMLDTTLALFKRLPARARGILGRLRNVQAGAGRRVDPAFAAWLDDDRALDRAAHIAGLAGERALSHTIREDFEHATRRDRERVHLESLTTLAPAQARRLESLRREERTVAGTPRARTLRRLRTRTERLFPLAYSREIDATFHQILREGWGIEVPAITPAWRDAVRFWLVVDDNRRLLERLLRNAAKTPGRSFIRDYPRNRRWLELHQSKMDVEAWLAPRQRTITIEDARFVVALEEDPLEILRMGIPFGTCLALDDGSNAASTVINAIEANKRVLYVRNESGSIVARKLLGLTNAGTLVGYDLYVSVTGATKDAITAAVLAMCQELAKDVGVPLADKGTPELIYARAFWYDDGEAVFDPKKPVPVPGYYAALGLPVPADLEGTQLDAERWRVRTENDLPAATAVAGSQTPEGRMHDAWIIRRLGVRPAIRLAETHAAMAFALFEALATDGPSLLRGLDIAGRLPEYRSHHRLAPLLQRFPASPKLGVAIVDLALRSMRNTWPNNRGHAHLALHELPPHFDEIAGALDLLDGVEPAWTWLADKVPSCARCIDAGIERCLASLEGVYDRAPDPDAIVIALMSRHRSHLAQRAAIRIAAQHVLPNGGRALVRFARLRPDLMTSADGLAAFVRQAAVERITPAVAKRAPVPSARPFEALRENVALPGIELVLGPFAHVAPADPLGPWEDAWRRRGQALGRDAVFYDRARRELLSGDSDEARRAPARTAVLEWPDGSPRYWMRLLDACGRRGDALTAARILDTRLAKDTRFSPRVLVDLWSIGDEPLRAALVAKLAREPHMLWCARVVAAEREAVARGTNVDGLLVRVAVALVEAGSPAVAIPSLLTIEQVRAVVDELVARAAPAHAAAAFVYLQDPLSVVCYRDALAAQGPARRGEILSALRKLELSSKRSKTFFAWLTS